MKVNSADILSHIRTLLQSAALSGEHVNNGLCKVRGLIGKRWGPDYPRPIDDALLKLGFDIAATRNLVADANVLVRELACCIEPLDREQKAQITEATKEAHELGNALLQAAAAVRMIRAERDELS